MAGFAQGVYNVFFRRNFTMLGVVFGGAFAFELTYNSITNKVFDGINRGRQWKDIRHKYVEGAEDGDDE